MPESFGPREMDPEEIALEEINPEEINRLADELIADPDVSATGFADELVGSQLLRLPSKFGWRYEAQQWGLARGLLCVRNNYVFFTPKGEALRAELHRRGYTIFVSPHRINS